MVGNYATHHRAKRAFTDVHGDKPLNLYFVLDQSGSIPLDAFNKSILFMKTLIDKVRCRLSSKLQVIDSKDKVLLQ